MCTASTSLIEIIFYPYSILKTHSYSDSIFPIYQDKALVLSCPLKDIRLQLILVGEDEHFTSSTLSELDGFNQKGTEFIAFVLLYQDNSRLYSFGLVQKCGK